MSGKKEYKKKSSERLEDKWREKVMYGQYYREMSDVADCEKSWLWLRRSDLKCETQACTRTGSEDQLC